MDQVDDLSCFFFFFEATASAVFLLPFQRIACLVVLSEGLLVARVTH